MHYLSLAVTNLFVAGALAGNVNHLVPRELQGRQDTYQVQGPDQSYQANVIPGGQVAAGTTCASLYGTGSLDCDNRGDTLLCYNPGQGDSCCNRNGGSP
ncbi:MAG: hypothetical protein LQ337_008994, partial [Flavoplaca oasis]